MGKTIVHAGGAGNGQAAKICNNMILGVSMIAVSEAFVLAEKLGLDAQKLFDISSKSSGQCWSMTTYCPVAGPVPTSPANRDYQAGFTAAMMLKDLKLSQEAARSAGAHTPLGAQAATLTFMVGGPETAFARALPLLEAMGKTIVHAGGAGNAQAAKICNNMVLGASMIVVSEAFLLAEKLGLDAQKLFDISSKSSGQCWSMTSYCPVPGPVPSSPANRDYKAGFSAAMMLKDLKLAQAAAKASHARTPLGAGAAAVYEQFVENADPGVDFSGIIRFLRG
jgi:3-hydroxyisobutyrate dehydrogenase-like beta-hydroxyacid dehydrogenase